MPKVKGDVLIGHRMYKEVCRLFPTFVSAAQAFRCDRKAIQAWGAGVTPGGLHLARLHYLGGDVIYVLTGKREAKDG